MLRKSSWGQIPVLLLSVTLAAAVTAQEKDVTQNGSIESANVPPKAGATIDYGGYVQLNAVEGAAADYWLSYAPSHSEMVRKHGNNCAACHVSDDATDVSRALVAFDLAANAAGDADDVLWYTAGMAPTAMQMGKYQIRLLTDDVLRSHLKLDARVALLVVGGPPKEAALKRGDVLLAVDEEPIETPIKWRAKLVDQQEEGEASDVELKLIRAGEPTKLLVKIAQLTPEKAPYRIGVHLEAPSEALRSQLNLYENEGIIVTEVVADSPASESGIKKHDILLRADGKRLSEREDLRAVIQACEGEPIEIVAMRAGKEIKVHVTPQRDKEVEETQAVCPAIGRWDYQIDASHVPQDNRFYHHPDSRYLFELNVDASADENKGSTDKAEAEKPESKDEEK